MTDALEFTILGSGASGGVPRADGDWGVCDPADPRNRRTRCSLMVRRISDAPSDQWTGLLVDTAPELRQQTAAAGLARLDAVLFTHDHADQSHGLDDVRAFAQRQRARVPCHMDEATQRTLMRRFTYIFRGEGGYPAICDDRLIPTHGEPWRVDGPSGAIPVVTFDQDHGGVRTVGYRFGGVAYCPDVVDLPSEAFEALRDLDVWIIDTLRYRPHPTHSHLEKTLAWIDRIKPRRAILTNMHIDLDFATLAKEVPAGVEPGYDGLRFVLPLAPDRLA